jgi:hypothetical protein
VTLLLAAAGGVTAFNVGFVLGAWWGGMWRRAGESIEGSGRGDCTHGDGNG